MDKQTQALVGAVILGVIALLLLSMASAAVYGAFNGGAPVLISIGALFGLFGCGATLGSLYGFSLARQ